MTKNQLHKDDELFCCQHCAYEYVLVNVKDFYIFHRIDSVFFTSCPRCDKVNYKWWDGYNDNEPLDIL